MLMSENKGAIANRRGESLDGPDFYPTPSWAVRALLSKEKFVGTVHEPCCGNGAIAVSLEEAGLTVIASDLYDHGFGIGCMDARELARPVENIDTNTPYNATEGMLARFLEVCDRKTALLLRLSFLESKRRYSLFAKSPPARLYVFSERLSLCKAGDVVNGGGTISYGWFVWERGHFGSTHLDWIPPGFKNAKY